VASFAHVNHGRDRIRLGVLLCINGTGSAVRWLRQNVGRKSYEDLNGAAATIPVGAEGLRFYPFGNGAERMLENLDPGATLEGLRFNNHGEPHLARAVTEGIANSFRYGIEILEEIGLRPKLLRAGIGNLFLSPVFREALAGVAGLPIELYATDGAEGAARGAALGASFYRSPAEAFRSLEKQAVIEPDRERAPLYREAYEIWAERLRENLRAGT
jgi:xylulokinase